MSEETHILVIDDDTFIQKFISRALQVMGCTVTVCSAGLEGIEKYREIGADVQLVLLDMIMPGMGGREVFVELHKINPDVRILLSSGFSVEEDVDSCMKDGAIGFLGKPYELQALQDAIRSYTTAD